MGQGWDGGDGEEERGGGGGSANKGSLPSVYAPNKHKRVGLRADAEGTTEKERP